MTQEEKAKAYDEALERAKTLQKTCDSQAVVGWCEYLFPELKSEDERIRRTLIDFFQDWHKTRSHCWSVPIPDILSWLEKQGEKLPVGFYYVNSEGKKFYSDTFKYGDVTLHVEKQGEQKSWSEEDDSILCDIVNHFDGFHLKHQTHEIFGWLVSLKHRIGG